LPTIKDVAKLAGVSHGTVSNVLNGYKSVNSSIVKRVEAAIKELGYQPNLKAGSMRNSRTHCIGVLLPNITDNIHTNLYNGIERIAGEAGYSISLYVSNGSPETEEELLLRMQQQRVDGAVILSCIPGKTKVFNDLLKSGTELVFVRRKPDGLKEFTFLGIDECQALFNVTAGLLRQGWRDITLLTGRKEYSNEKECTKGFLDAIAESRRLGQLPETCPNGGNTIIRIANEGKESAFRAGVQLLHTERAANERTPRALITTCSEYAQGIQAAVTMFSLNSSLVLFLDNDSWIREVSRYPAIRISQRYYQLGEEAIKELLLMIEIPVHPKAETIILPANPAPPLPAPEKPRQNERRLSPNVKKLRVLMLENASSVAARLMKPAFSEETGIPVEINTLAYGSMYGAIFDNHSNEHYEIMQINIPWIAESIHRKLIVPLEDLMGKDNGIRSVFSQEILEQHGIFNDVLYMAPFLIGTQLLFYRKDLFSDLRIRRLFYERNRKPLEVPGTWKDYDTIAEFFTRSCNPESPVPYGTTLGGPSGTYYFIPRLWERGVSLLREFPQEPNAAFLERIEETLGWYKASFEHANPLARDWDQTEQANQFCQGNAAMMVIYQAHFTDHVYQHESNISRENIGFAALPNRTSVLGGWSLGVSTASAMLKEAKCFLEWIFKDENILLHNILGGAIPSKNTFSSHEMKKVYPWLASASDSVYASRKMIDPEVHWVSQWEFECVTENILNRLTHNKINIKTAAEELWKRLADIKRNFLLTTE